MLGSQELQDLVDRMIDTMRAAPGVGLAAPQIGVPLQASAGAAGWRGGEASAGCKEVASAAAGHGCGRSLQARDGAGGGEGQGSTVFKACQPCFESAPACQAMHHAALALPCARGQVIVLEDRPEYIAAMAEGVPEMVQRVPFEPLAIVNPQLRALSQHGMRFYEGCLSVPHYQARLPQALGGSPQAHGWLQSVTASTTLKNSPLQDVSLFAGHACRGRLTSRAACLGSFARHHGMFAPLWAGWAER